MLLEPGDDVSVTSDISFSNIVMITQDDDGTVWLSWTDFRFLASRYQLTDRDPQIKMASEVSASIASAARKQP